MTVEDVRALVRTVEERFVASLTNSDPQVRLTRWRGMPLQDATSLPLANHGSTLCREPMSTEGALLRASLVRSILIQLGGGI